MKNSKIFAVKEKAKILINYFNSPESKKKLKDIYIEVNESYGGFFLALINNDFNDSYLNSRNNINLMSYYRDYLFHYEIYNKFISDYQNTIKKESLVDNLMKINIERIINSPIVYHNKKESYEQTLESIKLSFNSPFYILRNFLHFMNIEIEEMNVQNYLNEIKKSDLIEIKTQLNDEHFIGFSGKKINKKIIKKSDYLQIIKSNNIDSNYNDVSAKEKKQNRMLEDYFAIDKIILKELIANQSKKENKFKFEDEEIDEKIRSLINQIERKYNSYLDPKNLTLISNKILLTYLNSFQKEFKKIHPLIKYESKLNLLFSGKENIDNSKSSSCVSFLKKNSCRFIQAEKFGFRSIKINFGPGDLLFIGIPSESKLEFMKIMREKYYTEPLNCKTEAYPDLDFFLRHNIKVYTFILRKII